MNSIVIDTNPLAYIYNAIPDLSNKYANLLGEFAKDNLLLIPKIVYGELSLIFENDNELDSFLRDTGIIICEISSKAYVIAAERWQKYNKSRRILMCHQCGTKLGPLKCPKCNTKIKLRQHILSDFIIGAYALEIKGKTIVTNDAGYYPTYFPELNIIN